MITSPLTGNLGNHLFQYAITRVVAEERGFKWGFNPIPEYDYHHGSPQMDFLNVDYGEIHDYKYNEDPKWVRYIWKEQFQIVNHTNGDVVYIHPYQPEVFRIEDNTKLIIRCCQDARYFQNYKDKIQSWFSVREGYELKYRRILESKKIELDDKTVVLNVRGGEYRGVPELLLEKKYWNDTMGVFRDIIHKPKFLCVTDDIEYVTSLFGDEVIPIHISIGGDYYIINNAKYIGLSNSSFGIFPAWLNSRRPFVIAPRYWARHNVSTGYWANSDIWTFEWWFMDRNGEMYVR